MNVTINVTDTKKGKHAYKSRMRRRINPVHIPAVIRMEEQMERLLQMMERLMDSTTSSTPPTPDKNPAPFGVAGHEVGSMSSPNSNLAPKDSDLESLKASVVGLEQIKEAARQRCPEPVRWGAPAHPITPPTPKPKSHVLSQAEVDALIEGIKVGGFPVRPFKGATPF